MTLLISIAAVIVLLVFLAWRARRNPLFLGGAAAFVAMGRSAFIDILPSQSGQSLLSLPVVATGDLIFAALALGWLYARSRRPVPRIRLSVRWLVLGVFWASFLVLEFALAFRSAAELHPTLILVSRDWLYIPLGYLLTLDVLRRFSADEVTQYVGVLSLFTVCLMVLYVAAAFGLPVYPYTKSLVMSFGDAAIIRDFSTIPIWLGLAWGYYLSQQKKNGWAVAALAVLVAGTMLTYTRSLILYLAVTAGLALVLLMARRGQRARAIVIGVAGTAFAVAILVAGSAFAPAQYAYLMQRFGPSEQPGGPSAVLVEGTLAGRLDWFREARAAGALVDPIFGAGLFGGASFESYDSDWIRIVHRTGWAGMVVFAAPLILALWWGVSGFFSQGASSTTGRLLLMAVLATAFYAMERWTGLVYFWWPALSLLPVTLIAYATGRPMAGAAAASGIVDPRDEPARSAGGL